MITYGSVCSGIEADEPNRRVRDMVGHRNGRLVVVSYAGKTPTEQRSLWLCRCDCGGERVVQGNNLRATGTRSCGCLRREAAAARLLRDGAWNEGKSYSIQSGDKCYRTRHSWAKAALRHHGNRCERCGWDKARCDVHHRKPKANGGLHTIANAIVLCPNCHRVEHESGGGR